MKALNFLSICLLASSLNMSKARAHGGAEILIVLPVMVTINSLDFVSVSSRIMHQGFKLQGGALLTGVIYNGIVDKRNDVRYLFYKANTIDEAVSRCEGDGNKLATPEQVARLYSIRHVDRIGSMITSEQSKGYVIGFHEGSHDTFKMNVKTKEIELYDRETSEVASPVICVGEVHE